ncbi:hypothetical protein DI005_30165 [Prauserella sp. PE36]|uniref:Uncharacterized protein n=1 Tax=Prauserella endophytica TaxID=1592324 RepID=A0ABY2S778_9PSEU|nr:MULTISPECIES: hypothetical protein [Prauserella]PXY21763.1 hypothetical protein BAY59_30480 [Prauserella coralliicola]RBM13838.1 hypothetical protein DI005_30165 [Prauserella sp. PE36]TKG71553.1 hypothetical protein FCN18_12325 [Prauserella endophytica]
MTSYNRRFAAQLRRECRSSGDPWRAAETHLPNPEGLLASGFTFSGPLHAVLPLFGVYRGNSRVRVDRDCLQVSYGHWRFETPLANIADVTTVDGKVRITFHEPVHGHEPIGVRHRDFTVTVDDPEYFAEALRARIPRRTQSS